MKKSFMTRVLAVTLSAAMAFSLSSATSLTAPEAATKKLAANKKAASVSLKVGKSTTLKLKSYKTWNITKAASNKKAVATAKNAGSKAKGTVKVTAKKAGTATVTLTLGKRKVANSKSTKYTKKVTKKVTVKVTKATTTDTTPTDTTPTDTTPTETPTDSAVKVTPGALNIAGVTAKKVDTLAVSFSSVVASTGAVKITVTKGDAKSAVETKEITWNTESTEATIVTTAKMTEGTYTVSATDGKDTTTGTVEIKSQEVKEIKFLNETALTGANSKGEVVEAYVYYDVLDQYGESMKETTSIRWTPSTGTSYDNDRSKGMLTLRKSGSTNNTFTYGEKIYVTGVYTKSGVTNSGTFSVGTAQSVDSIEFVGFVKNGTTTIVDKLPASFKSNQYKVLYNAFDQNHNPLSAYSFVDNTTYIKGGLTFISDNVLVVEKIEPSDNVIINGVEYCAGNVVPGQNVNVGGTVNLSAVSTKTGQKSTLNFVIGEYRTLKKFEIGTPSDVVADGENVELPFTATDANGETITNFVELATQSDFSKLQFSSGHGSLTLEQKDDGSAKLVWKDSGDDAAWNSSSADGIDRPISLTAIVVGGETSNQMLYVSDKARPEAISDVDISDAMVNKSTQKLGLNRFTFLDQYGRNIKKLYDDGRMEVETLYDNRDYDDGGVNKGYIYDNGFFYQTGRQSDGTRSTSLSADGFNGYTFGVCVQPAGTADVLTPSALSYANANATETSLVTGDSLDYDYVLNVTKPYSGYEAYTWVSEALNKTVVKEPTFKFSIVKRRDSDGEYEGVSTKLSKTVKIVDLNKLTNFAVGNLPKFSIRTTYTNAENGEAITQANMNNAATSITDDNTTSFIVQNSEDLSVTGMYSGTKIDVPEYYYSVVGDKLTTSTGTTGDKKITTVKAGTLIWKELYDFNTAKNLRKDASDTLKVSVIKQSGSGLSYGTDYAIQMDKTAYISDAPSEVSVFTAADAVTIHPTNTVFNVASLIQDYDSAWANAASDNTILIQNQYGKNLFKLYTKVDKLTKKYSDGGTIGNCAVTFKYLVKDIVENENGYVKNNFKVSQNSTAAPVIAGAELGDTFTLVVTAECADKTLATGDISKTIKVTVGHDDNSKINESTNYYTKYTVNNVDLGVEYALKAQLAELYATNNN